MPLPFQGRRLLPLLLLLLQFPSPSSQAPSQCFMDPSLLLWLTRQRLPLYLPMLFLMWLRRVILLPLRLSLRLLRPRPQTHPRFGPRPR